MQRIVPFLLLLPALVAVTPAAEHDNDVEWNGLSHIGWQDRAPRVPLRDEAFNVRFQAFHMDLTSARVRQFVAGTPMRVFEATVVHRRGPYDVWEAAVDGRDAAEVRYDIEVTDGSDTDYLGAAGVGDNAPAGGPYVLDFDTLSHAPLGATPVTGGVVFRTWAPNAPTMHVRGTFNNWSLAHPLPKVGEEFIGVVPGAAAGDAYKFYFQHSDTWKPDAFARRLDPSSSDDSIVVDPDAYAWASAPFSPPPFEEWVCYQLHVGTFSGRNDPAGFAPSPSRFVDAAARVGHLVELGVNVVYLNPILEFPGDNSGGYNPITQTAIESALGTPEDLKSFVDACHANGIAVMLDVVVNHLDFSGNFLFQYTGPAVADNVYFDTPPINTPWGPQLDLDRARVRQFVLDSLVMMLDEYRMDGFRVDGISALSWGQQPGPSNQLLRDLNALADQRYVDKLMLAEVFGDDPWFTRSLAAGGLGFDSQYHTSYKDAVRGAAFDAAFGDPNVSALNWAATRGGLEELQGVRAFHYFELHDDAWPLNNHERAVRTIDPSFPHDDEFAAGRTKVALGTTLLSKGIPAMLHGSEWLEDEGWEFHKIDWAHRQTYSEVFDYYRTLVHLRTSAPALFADRGALQIHTNENDNVFAFERYELGGGSFVVLANVGNGSWPASSAYRIGLPRGGTWSVIVNSEAAGYFGGGAGPGTQFRAADAIPYDGQPWSIALELPAHCLLVLEHEPSDCNGNGISDLLDTASGTSPDEDRDGIPDECETLGESYCGPNGTNSTGQQAHAFASGNLEVAQSALTLHAEALPPNQFGYLLCSRDQGMTQFPGGSQGILCLGGTIGRFVAQVQSSGAAGELGVPVDLSALPLSPAVAALPGETWNFQFWYRDVNPQPTSNFTDGVSLTFE